MPPWTFVTALPGLDASRSVEAGDVAIIPTSDDRFSEANLAGFNKIQRYLAQFRSVKRRPVKSLLVIRKSGLPKIMRGDLTFLRNAVAISVVCLARAKRCQRKVPADPSFTDAFDFPPVWLRLGTGLLVETPSVIGLDTQSSFCGHPPPAYPFGSESNVVWDDHLLSALLSLFGSKQRADRAFRRRVERVLQMAYQAFRAPGDNLSSENDWGVSHALTVSAFESIANVAGSVDIQALQKLIGAIPWPERLRRDLRPYEYRSPRKRFDRNGAALPLQRMTRPVQVYARLYRTRNMVLHGEDYERRRLEPGRRHKSWGPLHLEAAVVFRCLLLHTLAKNGHGAYLAAPKREELRGMTLADGLKAFIAAGDAHDSYYEALGYGVRRRRQRPLHTRQKITSGSAAGG